MNKALKILTAASLMLTVATTAAMAAMAANVQDAPDAVMPRAIGLWDVSTYPGNYDSGLVGDTADTNRGYCFIFCSAYSSAPSKCPVKFTSTDVSYDTVHITSTSQIPQLYYKPEVRYGTYFKVSYSVYGGDSRITANGWIDG